MPNTERSGVAYVVARGVTVCLSLVLVMTVLCCRTAQAEDSVVVGLTHRIHSDVLGEDRTYRVCLPDSYSWARDRRFPVLYVLDGESNFLHTASSVSFLAAHGEIPEMIVVGVDSTVRIRDFTQTDWPSVWIGGGGADNFKRFLSAELLPSINRTYRTDGFRVLSGHSASGQFVLHCLASEPSLFQAYVALSPSLDWDGNLPQRSLEKSFRKTTRLGAFLYVARSDDFGRALADYQRLVRTLRTTSPRGFRWRSKAFPEETHVGVPLLGQIDALRCLYSGYRFHDDMMKEGLASATRHFESVSRTVGWPLPVPEGVINNFGYAALSKGKTADAIALFERNVKANPNSANAFDSLADGYAKAERWKEAAAASEKALALADEFDLPNRAYFESLVKKMRDKLNAQSERSP